MMVYDLGKQLDSLRELMMELLLVIHSEIQKEKNLMKGPKWGIKLVRRRDPVMG